MKKFQRFRLSSVMLAALVHPIILHAQDKASPPASIIGGAPTTAFPAVGMIMYPIGNNQALFCTATVVAPTKILTAGHCVLNDRIPGTASWKTSKFTFYTGEQPLVSAAATVTSIQVDTPPQFANYSEADIANGVAESFSDSDMAIITLSAAVPVQAMNLASTAPAAGTGATLVGYGLTNANDSSTYGVKNTVTTTLLAQDSDLAILHWGDAAHTVCHGDSGSPVLQQTNGSYAVIAVVSTTTGNCVGQGNGPSIQAQSSWLSTILGPPAASGPTPGTVYRILSVASGGAVDLTAANTANGAIVQEWQYWGGANQRWGVRAWGDGTLGVVSQLSGRCWDIAYGSTQAGTGLQQWDCWGGAMQRWRFNPASTGYELVNQATGQCVDLAAGSAANGTKIEEWPCHGGTNQMWSFEPVNAAGQALE